MIHLLWVIRRPRRFFLRGGLEGGFFFHPLFAGRVFVSCGMQGVWRVGGVNANIQGSIYSFHIVDSL